MELYLAGVDRKHLINSKNERLDDTLYSNALFSYLQKNDINSYIYNRNNLYDITTDLLNNKGYFYKAMRLYLAGADKFRKEEVKQYMKLYLAEMEESCVDKIDCNALFSYIDKGKLQFDKLKDFIKPGKLFIDSGAFSAWTKGAKINVKEYIRWLNERAEDIHLCGTCIDRIAAFKANGIEDLISYEN